MPKSSWEELIERKPSHTEWFINKFETKAAQGEDILREARFVEALVPPRSRILDAGCGFGRHARALLANGHQVVGIDVDPGLIEYAQKTIDGGIFINANLDNFTLPAAAPKKFDAIFAAGNVVTFFHPDTRVPILRNLMAVLADTGRIAVGFGAGRGYSYVDFFADTESAGLQVDATFSTWDLRPFREGDNFLVALLSKAKKLQFAPLDLIRHRQGSLSKAR